MNNSKELNNGICIAWKDNKIGGRTYYSDEVGIPIQVWDTSLVNKETLQEIFKIEDELNKEENNE